MTIASLLCLASLAAAGAPELRHEARALTLGEAVLFVATDHHPEDPPKGSFGGRELAFFRSGSTGTWLAFSAIDLEASTGPARLVVDLKGADGAPRRWDQALTISTKAFPTRRLRVDPRYVRPSPEEEARAERESARLLKVFSTVTPERLWNGGFSSPIPGAVVSRFGNRSVFNGVPKAPHAGADLAAGLGTPVKVPARGRVALTGDFFYPGRLVVLDHGWGVYSSYSHLSRIEVKEGDVLEPGDVLGLVGKTGRVTGPHLHWAVKVLGGRVDPFSLVALPLDSYR